MKKLIVFHTEYGCETGCCGHVLKWIDADGCGGDEYFSIDFEFDHPPFGADADGERKWAMEWVRRKFGAEHVADLDWEKCEIVNDC